MKIRILTIGVYGFDENAFFNALVNAGVDTFCDIRARRGMRGSQYSFVNSTYLQNKLKHLSIHYHHLRDLAPSEGIRSLQQYHDKQAKVAKRARAELSPQFVEAYQKEILTDFSANAFLSHLEPMPHVLVLFCVEREPKACHRSIIANKLAEQLNIAVEDILP